MMKKTFSLFLSLWMALFGLFSASSFAAAEETSLTFPLSQKQATPIALPWDEENQRHFYFSNSLMVGNFFYVLSPNRLYRLVIEGDEANLSYLSFTSPAFEGLGFRPELFYWQNQLYILNLYTGEAFTVDEKARSLSPTPALTLALDDEINIDNLTLQGVYGNRLFLTYSDYRSPFYNHSNLAQWELYSVDLETGQQTHYGQTNIRSLIPGSQEEILAWAYNDSFTRSSHQIGTFNPDEDIFTPWPGFIKDDLAAPCYHQPSQTLYYFENNQFYAARLEQEPVLLTYLYDGGNKGFCSPDGRYYMSVSGDGIIYALPTTPTAYGTRPLLVDQNIDPEIIEHFQKNNPQIPFQTKSLEGFLTAQSLLTQNLPLDVIHLRIGAVDFGTIKQKAYAYPLSSSDKIRQQVGAMYPYVQRALTHKGEIYALPLRLSFYLPAYRQDTLNALGLTREDMPATWEEYLAFIIHWQEELADEHPDFYLFTADGAPDPMRLTLDIVDACIQRRADGKEEKVFDTPLFRRLMALVDEIDFDYPMSKSTDLGHNPDVLFTGYSFHGGGVHSPEVPLLLSLVKGEPPYIKISGSLAMINPYTQNPAGALAFFENLLDSYPQDLLRFLYSGEHTPIEYPSYQEDKANTQAYLEETKQALERAPEAEKAALEELIENLTKALAFNETSRWLIAQEDINAFNALAPSMRVPMDERLTFWSDGKGIYSLVFSYFQGEMSLDELIAQGDQIIEMSYLEGQ